VGVFDPFNRPLHQWSHTIRLVCLAELWKLNIRTVRRIFNDAPGVIRVGSAKAGNRKRGYFTLRIPASVAEREHQRLAAAGSKEIAQ
jgi:hypothetical protein